MALDATPPTIIRVTCDLSPEAARALAQLCKRIGWSDAMRLSVDEREANLQIFATGCLRTALEEAGVYVR
jgi:hypothetical protein